MYIEIKDFISQINIISDEFIEFIEQKSDVNNDINVSLIKNNIYEKVKKLTDIEKPKIMMCGIYDAGKSTLINALLRRNEATISDRPETYRIDEYDNGSYILIDSPGVDAPIEHEKITKQYLSKCHIIFFVVSTKGTFESETNYKYIYDFIKTDTPFVIILNDKDGIMDKDRIEIIRIKHKIIQNLKRISGIQDIDKKYEIITVNAKRALKGVLEDKKTMYKKSKISMVENKIDEIMQRDKALYRLLMPINNLNNIMDEYEKNEIMKLNEFSDKNYSKYIESIKQKRKTMQEEIIVELKGIISKQKKVLINRCIDEECISGDSIIELVLDEVDNMIKIKLSRLSSFIKINFKELNIQVDEKCNFYNNEICINDINIEKNDFDKIHYKSNKIKDDIKSHRKNISSDINNQDDYSENSFSDILKTSLLELVFKKVEEFFNKDEIKYNKYLEEVELKNQAEINRVNEEIRIRKDIESQVSYVLEDVYKEVINSVNKEINNKFDQIENFLLNCVQYNDSEKKYVEENLKKIRDLRDKLDSIKSQII